MERATHEAGVAEKNQVDVEMQRNRELKKGGRSCGWKRKSRNSRRSWSSHAPKQILERAPSRTRSRRGRHLGVSSARCARLLYSSFVYSFWLIIYRPARGFTGGEKEQIDATTAEDVPQTLLTDIPGPDCGRPYTTGPDGCQGRTGPREARHD